MHQMSKTTASARLRTYTTAHGAELEFRPISAWTINHLNSQWEAKKPLPPKIKSAEGFEDYHTTDAEYVHKLTMWTQDKGAAINEAMFRIGIVSEPPADFVELYANEFPEIETKNVKVHWVYSLLDPNEVENFINILMGQTAITEAGLKEAAGTFPSTD